jgi:hypothetical protein
VAVELVTHVPAAVGITVVLAIKSRKPEAPIHELFVPQVDDGNDMEAQRTPHIEFRPEVAYYKSLGSLVFNANPFLGIPPKQKLRRYRVG